MLHPSGAFHQSDSRREIKTSRVRDKPDYHVPGIEPSAFGTNRKTLVGMWQPEHATIIAKVEEWSWPLECFHYPHLRPPQG